MTSTAGIYTRIKKLYGYIAELTLAHRITFTMDRFQSDTSAEKFYYFYAFGAKILLTLLAEQQSGLRE